MTHYFFIDVDGTLIDKDFNVRPYAQSLIDICFMPFSTGEKCNVVVWSGGGARHAANRTNNLKNISGFVSKDSGIIQKLKNNQDVTIHIIDNDEEFLKLMTNKYKRFYVESYEKQTMELEDPTFLNTIKIIAEMKNLPPLVL